MQIMTKRLQTASKALVAAVFLGVPGIAYAEDVIPVEDTGSVYFLTPGQTSPRWVRYDAPGMKMALAEMAPNMTFEVLDAGDDVNKQQRQLEAAIANGAKGIILTAVDGTNVSGMLAQAQAAGVPVVGYAHDITGGDMSGLLAAQVTTLLAEDYHVPHCINVGEKAMAGSEYTADAPFKLGLYNFSSGIGIGKIIHEGCMKALQPAIDAGKLRIVCEQDLADFTAATAQKATEQCLTAQGNDINGFSVGNDDQADGIFAALSSQGIQDKVMIYGGYDATPTGIQRVVAGYQDFDIYPPFSRMPVVAMQTLLSAINPAVPLPAEVDARYLDAAKVTEGGVPAAFLRNTKVRADNLDQTVIADGLYTKEQICAGIAVNAPYCAK